MTSIAGLCVEVYLLCVGLACAVFCAWVLRTLKQGMRAVVIERKGSHSYGAPPPTSTSAYNTVLCPCILKKYTTVQSTMGFTMATVTSFMFSCAAFGIQFGVMLATASSRENVWINIFGNICLLVGYILMLVTHFERLRLTFWNTSHRLPKWAPNVLYIALSLEILMFVAIYAFFWFQLPAVSAICLLFVALCYFASVSALITSFFKKTVAVASADEDHLDEDLLDTAVRVTVSATVSLVSTTGFWLLWGPYVMLSLDSWAFDALFGTIPALDMALNSFCLLCTLNHAKGHYLRVFGGVHRFVLAHVSATIETEAASRARALSASDSVEKK